MFEKALYPSSKEGLRALLKVASKTRHDSLNISLRNFHEQILQPRAVGGELQHGKAGRDQTIQQVHLRVIIAFEFNVHAIVCSVHVQYAGLFEKKSLDAVRRPRKAKGQDSMLAQALQDF